MDQWVGFDRDKYARLAGCLSAARRIYVSNGILKSSRRKYGHRTLWIELPSLDSTCTLRADTDNYESSDLAHNTIVVINAIETIYARDLHIGRRKLHLIAQTKHSVPNPGQFRLPCGENVFIRFEESLEYFFRDSVNWWQSWSNMASFPPSHFRMGWQDQHSTARTIRKDPSLERYSLSQQGSKMLNENIKFKHRLAIPKPYEYCGNSATKNDVKIATEHRYIWAYMFLLEKK